MQPTRALIVWAVLSVIIKDDKILCLKRQNTSFYDGYWALPAGKLDNWEMPTVWAARELYEEVWLKTEPSAYTKIHIMYARVPDSPDQMEGRFYFFGAPNTWEGEVQNMEPNKASEVGWFPLSELPEPFIPMHILWIKAILWGDGYSEYEGKNSDSQRLPNL